MTKSEYLKEFFFFLYDGIYLKYLMVYTPAIAIAIKNFIYSVIGFEISWLLICTFFLRGDYDLYKRLMGFSLHPVNQIIFIIQAFYIGISYRASQYYGYLQKIGDFFSNIFQSFLPFV